MNAEYQQKHWVLPVSILAAAVIIGGGIYLRQKPQTAAPQASQNLQNQSSVQAPAQADIEPNGTNPANNDENKISALCADAPITTSIGRMAYPIDTKYESLEFLGQVFTAYDCGPERVNKIFGVKNGIYTIGSTIWLKNNPDPALINAFESIGFTCGEEGRINTDCKKWELWDPVTIDDLMKTEQYHENFESDDCTICGG